MIRLLHIIVLLLTLNSFSQNSLVGNWQTNFPIGQKNVNKFIMSDGSNYIESYGNLNLNADNTFRSQDTPPCGNDCSRAWVGTYKIVGDSIIFSVKKLITFGFCQKKIPEQLFDPELEFGIFKIKMGDGLVTLQRI